MSGDVDHRTVSLQNIGAEAHRLGDEALELDGVLGGDHLDHLGDHGVKYAPTARVDSRGPGEGASYRFLQSELDRVPIFRGLQSWRRVLPIQFGLRSAHREGLQN